MIGPRVELAVLNNVHWYEAMFRAHGFSCTIDGQVWMSHGQPPPFHSNLVVISPMLTQQHLEVYIHDLEKGNRIGGWSMKDSYARFDLTAFGFEELFRANWIWHEPTPATLDPADSEVAWSRVGTSAELFEWEAAWRGDPKMCRLRSSHASFHRNCSLVVNSHFSWEGATAP